MPRDTKGAERGVPNAALGLGFCGQPVRIRGLVWDARPAMAKRRRKSQYIQAHTGAFPRPGTLFATTLKRKVSAMSVSLPAPVVGCKTERAEGLQ